MPDPVNPLDDLLPIRRILVDGVATAFVRDLDFDSATFAVTVDQPGGKVSISGVPSDGLTDAGDGLEESPAGTIKVKLDGTTLAISASGIKLSAATIASIADALTAVGDGLEESPAGTAKIKLDGASLAIGVAGVKIASLTTDAMHGALGHSASGSAGNMHAVATGSGGHAGFMSSTMVDDLSGAVSDIAVHDSRLTDLEDVSFDTYAGGTHTFVPAVVGRVTEITAAGTFHLPAPGSFSGQSVIVLLIGVATQSVDVTGGTNIYDTIAQAAAASYIITGRAVFWSNGTIWRV